MSPDLNTQLGYALEDLRRDIAGTVGTAGRIGHWEFHEIESVAREALSGADALHCERDVAVSTVETLRDAYALHVNTQLPREHYVKLARENASRVESAAWQQ